LSCSGTLTTDAAPVVPTGAATIVEPQM